MIDRIKAEKIVSKVKDKWGDSANEIAVLVEELFDVIRTMWIAGEMKLLPIGSKVQLEEGITGTILEVLIKDEDCVEYRISWWNGRSRCVEWFGPDEFEHTTPIQRFRRIGFLRDGQST